MYNRFILILIVLFTSCSYFSSSKNEQGVDDITSIIDFTKVDVSPSFTVYNDLIDDKKTDCFRKEIHQQLSKNLSKHAIRATGKIDTLVNLDLLIDAQGKIHLKHVGSPEIVRDQLPTLDSILKISLNELPVLSPAYKRGIPVVTQYRFPIRIELKE